MPIIKCNFCGNDILDTDEQCCFCHRMYPNDENYQNIVKQNRISHTKPLPLPTPSIPRCPKCGSISVTSSARGINLIWGLLGASSTVNRCANCGNTWKPTGQ